MKKLKYKILISSLIGSLLLFAIVFSASFYFINNIGQSSITETEKIMRDNFDRNIKEQVQNAVSLIDSYYQKSLNGELTNAEAMDRAAEGVRRLKYGVDGYFWIDDYSGNNVAMLGRDDIEGKNRLDLVDVNGFELIKNIIEVGQDPDGGYTDYYFPKPGSDEALPKRGYSLSFAPYNWVIGTGNYTDDIDVLIAEKRAILMAEITSKLTYLTIFGVIAIIISAIFSYILGSKIAKPIVATSSYLGYLSDGDFSKELENKEKLLKSKDETGDLVYAIDNMRNSVVDSINTINSVSDAFSESLTMMHGQLANVTSEIDSVSATTEEIAASMEETTASAHAMSQTADEIDKASEGMAMSAQDGAKNANEIRLRAEDLSRTAINSKNTAEEIYEETKVHLLEAIEKTKNVDEINNLAATILEITNQTNLLALNASIEAARAGEAGRGFAVVADEIGKLADNSTEAVAEIQNITKVVVASVNDLNQRSKDLLEFLSTQVINDYDSMVSTGESYNEDASTVNEMVSDYSATAEELTASIQNVVQSLSEVSSATEETAKGTQNIVESTTNINTQAAELLQQSENINDGLKELLKAISKFKV
ncbi:MAG: methyl-accepting chemotaxis protein [Firmicutes bacterium]|jgi:methyl-accepting chemotaxis protein|nr:methyl-accepting chemotaxis protein [Bacillota bacterium]